MSLASVTMRGNRLFLQWILFAIILVEGYVVLATELLALRVLVAYVGSDTAIISIIVSAVLMPLAAGYYKGGQKYHTLRTQGKYPSIRKLLARNIAVASIFLALGLSHVFLELYFSILTSLGITSRIYQAMVYSILFLVYPVYILGQTTPLVSNYFSSEVLSKITGKMLFCSTLGSFMGAIISSLLLMHLIGVNNTVILTISLLGILFLILNKEWVNNYSVLMASAFLIVVYFNSNGMMQRRDIVANNQYHMIAIEKVKGEPGSRVLNINRSEMSKFTLDRKHRFGYIAYMEDQILHYLPQDSAHPRKVLVIGAGGFTVGLGDTVNQYDFIDIDEELLKVAEQDFLKQKLTPNKKFIVEPARVYLRHSTQTYDVIVLDTFSNNINIPYDLVTQEYLQQVKKALNPDGVVVANIIESGNYADDWTIKFDNTFRSVFHYYNRVPVQTFNPWIKNADQLPPDDKLGTVDRNIMYVYYNRDYSNDKIYTDNKNDYFLDR